MRIAAKTDQLKLAKYLLHALEHKKQRVFTLKGIGSAIPVLEEAVVIFKNLLKEFNQNKKKKANYDIVNEDLSK